MRRSIDKLLQIIKLALALPAVLLIRLIRPIKLIYLGPLATQNIGHYAANTELYLCRREALPGWPASSDIFYELSPICTRQLQIMWRRQLNVCNLVKWIDIANRLIPGGRRHQISWPFWGERDIQSLLSKTEPHLHFTQSEEEQGRQALIELGVPAGNPFFCIHARDSAYLDSLFPGTDLSANDYRDSEI